MNRFFSFRKMVFLLAFCSLLLIAMPSISLSEEKKETDDKIARQGAEVEFAITPLHGKEVREGEFAVIQFRIKDGATGAPIQALRPSVWVDLKTEFAGEKGGAPLTCKDKIGLYLQGTLSYRPDIDLNSYFILSLNNDGTIAVTDPIVSLRGITQLYTMIYLKRPGEDWVLSNDEKNLFVTMPKANQVAVVNTETFKVIQDINSGINPVRIALQPDGRYLWVGNDTLEASASGVTVIDTDGLRVVAQIATGAGHHEMTFSDDSLFAFVTNEKEGTLSVIDVQALKKIKDLPAGRNPGAVAFSSLSKSVYVISEGEGTMLVVDGKRHEEVHRMKLTPGLKALRFAPGHRYGFVANAKEDLIYIFDASNNQILHRIQVGKEPDQISFTKTFAYIRCKGTVEAILIQLTDFGKEGTVPVIRIAMGQNPPGSSPFHSVADAIIPTPEDGHALIANPADKMIYYYMEGMSVPMGSFRSYGGYVQKAVRVVDRSLREKEPGVYYAGIRVPARGKYQVAFLLDSPRVLHCFEFSAKENPALAKKFETVPKIEFLTSDRKISVGKDFRLQFKLMDPSKNEPMIGVKDVVVQTTLAPGVWNERFVARDRGDGVYEVNFTPPRPGAYYLSFACPSLKVDFRGFPSLILQATGDKSSK